MAPAQLCDLFSVLQAFWEWRRPGCGLVQEVRMSLLVLASSSPHRGALPVREGPRVVSTWDAFEGEMRHC